MTTHPIEQSPIPHSARSAHSYNEPNEPIGIKLCIRGVQTDAVSDTCAVPDDGRSPQIQ
jgi:hypothetical protein